LLRLRHLPTDTVVVERLEEADDSLRRAIGLLGRGGLEPGTGLWSPPWTSIHMFGMRFAIDAVFLDRRHRAVRVVAGLRPWRTVPLVWRAASVVELPAGRATEVGIRPGDQLRIELRTSDDPGGHL
jgi:uncharacterized membrane protein (UPF0127 family)